jgi:hypothetical protein
VLRNNRDRQLGRAGKFAVQRQSLDLPPVLGLGLLLMPLTTMWHEIGGHAVACIRSACSSG